MAGAHCIAIECQESRIEKRLETRYLDRRAATIDEALEMIAPATEPTSVGLLGNAAEIVPEMLARGIRPDAITDQTSAHDPVNGYLPMGWTVAEWIERRERDPEGTAAAARISMARHVEALLSFKAEGTRSSTMATTSARKRSTPGSSTPSTSPASCRPTSAPVLPRHGPVPLGRAERRSRGHLQDRRQGEGADPRRSPPPPLARHGARADRLPGPAGPDLLGRPRPAPPPRPRLQRDGRAAASSRPRS